MPPYEIGQQTLSVGLAPGQQEAITDVWCKETAGQTYKAGDLVYWDTNGTIAICTNTTQQLDSQILGQALVDATGTTGAQTRVKIIRPGDIYYMNLFHLTAASAVGTQASVGLVKGIYLSAAGRWHVDLNNSVEGSADTLGRVRIVGWPYRGFDGAANTITDIYAVVSVVFLSVSFAQTGTAAIKRVLQYQG